MDFDFFELTRKEKKEYFDFLKEEELEFDHEEYDLIHIENGLFDENIITTNSRFIDKVTDLVQHETQIYSKAFDSLLINYKL